MTPMRADETTATGPAYPPDPERPDVPARARPGLVPGSAFWGWAGPLLITALGAFLRFNRLSVPKAVVFDETYYVGDAWAILQHGVEINHVKNANALLAAGSTKILAGTQGELVAHPPLGKMMIAVGEWLFGLTPFGWRFSVALIGSLAILMLARIVRRMTGSTLLGCIAGLLLALDGLELVLSRTAILDIFVMFWVLAAFGLLVIDRDRGRARLAAAADALGQPGSGEPDPRGPRLGIRWLRVAAGLCLGAAVACKWNGVWYILAFGVLVLAWDLGARRAAGFPARLAGVLRSDAKWLPVSFGVAPAVVYIASWTGWFATPYGYDRNGARFNPGGHHTSTIVAWLQYNKWMLQFGLGLTSGQTYKSNPLGWLVLARPILRLPAGQAVRRGRLDRAGGPGHRDAGHLVGGHRGDRVLPGVVAHAARLAGRGRAAGHRGRLAAVDLVLPARPAHRVLLLRRDVRAVPDHRHHAVPGADHRAGPGQPRPARRRGRDRRRLPARRPGQLRLPVSHPGRPGHPVFGVALPDVVPELDLS
jgi:dolichyl-phosphate-mannose-protein mannosyltransferase